MQEEDQGINPFGEHKATPKHEALTIGQFCRWHSSYDDMDACQRGLVWSRRKKLALIKSIVDGKPINPIHVICKHPGNPSDQEAFWVADGKQRVDAIWSFFNDEFEVPVAFVPPQVPRQRMERLTYGEVKRRMEEDDDPTCAAIIRAFDGYNLDMYYYQPMELAGRMKLYCLHHS